MCSLELSQVCCAPYEPHEDSLQRSRMRGWLYSKGERYTGVLGKAQVLIVVLLGGQCIACMQMAKKQVD